MWVVVRGDGPSEVGLLDSGCPTVSSFVLYLIIGYGVGTLTQGGFLGVMVIIFVGLKIGNFLWIFAIYFSRVHKIKPKAQVQNLRHFSLHLTFIFFICKPFKF